ncbi:MAG: hypothetical protein OEZ03_02265 [Alphaproteobacteria bacterium]|nr:hypothetical protein [Alphaproteobacteria bacterium]
MPRLILYIGLLAALFSSPAHAYIGPGAGAGTIAIVLGVIGSFFLAFVAILWYPLKRLIKRWKTVAPKSQQPDADPE